MRNRVNFVGDFQDARHAMGPVRRMIALAGERPVHLPDPRRVVDRAVDLRGGRTEPRGQCVQASFDKAIVIGWEVDPVQQMAAVAAVGQDAIGRQTVVHAAGQLECRLVFGVGRGNPRQDGRHRRRSAASGGP